MTDNVNSILLICGIFFFWLKMSTKFLGVWNTFCILKNTYEVACPTACCSNKSNFDFPLSPNSSVINIYLLHISIYICYLLSDKRIRRTTTSSNQVCGKLNLTYSFNRKFTTFSLPYLLSITDHEKWWEWHKGEKKTEYSIENVVTDMCIKEANIFKYYWGNYLVTKNQNFHTNQWN